MVNLLGEDGYSGEAIYKGIEQIMSWDGVHVHLYGKKLTKPFRKMGHITITDRDMNHLKELAKKIKKSIKVIA
jgi:5-(carboxyamino)imidazole ribonucleotide synthase